MTTNSADSLNLCTPTHEITPRQCKKRNPEHGRILMQSVLNQSQFCWRALPVGFSPYTAEFRTNMYKQKFIGQAVAMATLVRSDEVMTDLEGLLSILYRYFVQSAVD